LNILGATFIASSRAPGHPATIAIDGNNAWIRLDFPWCRQRINVLGTGKIFDILSSLLQAFFTPAG
jgi:hypothetical protein